MVTTSGVLFHIDFGHFLGNIKTFLVRNNPLHILIIIIILMSPIEGNEPRESSICTDTRLRICHGEEGKLI